MRIFDVNVLVLAHRRDQPGHGAAREFVDQVVAGQRPYHVPPVVGSGVIRVSTHPRVFREPTPLDEVISFLDVIRSRRSHVQLPDVTTWPFFTKLCQEYDARGNRVPDAYLAALAIVNGAALVTADQGLGRYRELTIERPRGL